VNPFDVIKTRLQTQSSPEPMFVPSSKLPPPLASGFRTDASTSKLNAATCCQSTYFTTNKNSDSLLCKFDPRLTPAASLPSSRAKGKGKAPAIRSYYTSAARSAAISTECSFPTPIAAASDLTARSAEAASRQYKGFFDALAKIVRNEGVGTLWRGVGPSLAISVPSQATYMVGYDYLRRVMLAHPLPFLVSAEGQASEIHKVGAPLVAGSLVRACLVTFFSPIELIRTRLQSLPASSSAATVTRSTLDLVKLQGVGTLWRGLPATLWRDVPFSGIYWASYEILQRMMTGSGFGEGGHGRKSRDTFATAFIGGAVSGSVRRVVLPPMVG
jgi:solute carrier family 25 protein 39/40